jgi:hypothetical protein
MPQERNAYQLMVFDSDDPAIDEIVEELRAAFKDLAAPTGEGAVFRLLVARDLPGKTRIEIRREPNHARAHFHAYSRNGCDVSVDIKSIEVLASKCRGKILKAIQSWAYDQRERLVGLWNRLNPEFPVISFDLEA